MDNTKRARFYRWLIKNVAKTPEGEILPSWVQWVWRLLFPAKALYYRIDKMEGYQPRTDTWHIHGYEFSAPFFHHLAHGGDEMFKIISRENGIISFERQ